jgi:hypothetical protein
MIAEILAYVLPSGITVAEFLIISLAMLGFPAFLLWLGHSSDPR